MVWKRVVLLCCLALWFAAGGVPVAAYDYDNAIRVRLAADSAAGLTVAVGSYTVANSDGVLCSLAVGDSVKVTYSGSQYKFNFKDRSYAGSGDLLFSSSDGRGRLTYGGVQYRGDMRLTVADGQAYLVNILAMEEYLYSVVNQEIGGYYPSLAALKAQAICCRSLAVYWLQPRSYYDVVPTTTNQVYAGYSGEATGSYGELIRRAVDETKKQILYYTKDDGSAIRVQPYYSANAGGKTEDITNVWGSNAASYPYAKGVDSDVDSLPFVGENGSLKFPTSHRWQVIYTADKLVETLADRTGTDIGTLRDIQVNRVNTVTGQSTASGRVYTITYVGSKGSLTLDRGQARTTLGFRSSLYEVIFSEHLSANQPINTLSLLSDDSFTVTMVRTGHYIVFEGLGYGHGVGLSQWGACVMAYQGYDYMQILDHYFNQGKNDGRLYLVAYNQ